MPEFILDMGSPDHANTFNALDEFTQGYIEALFFTDEAPGTDEESWDPEVEGSFPGSCGFSDLAPESLEAIKRDCDKFQRSNEGLLQRAYDMGFAQDHYNAKRAGSDFWFTRNGHGVGFWDRQLGEVGEFLTAASKTFGEVWTTFGDDGRIHVSG